MKLLDLVNTLHQLNREVVFKGESL
jgi:hypothetical protein